MKKYFMIKGSRLKRQHIIDRPVNRFDLTFDDLYNEEQEVDFSKKLSYLQTKQWRKLKHQLT